MTHRIVRTLWCVAVFGFLLSSTPLLKGQTGGGSVAGVVHDPSGAVIPHANVILTGVDTGAKLTSVSSSSGQYIFPVVPVGNYTLTFSASGFSQLVHENITVSLGKTITVDAALRVGAANATVQVEALSSQIETNTAQASTTIDQQTYDDLPMALQGQARSTTIIADLMPGVADNPSNGYGSNGTTGQMFNETINGGQSWGGQVLYDGIPMDVIASGGSDYRTQPIPVEALQEFSLVQNNFDPVYGRTPGGVLTYSTRSGTNAFHGQAYEYLRNNDLDAVGYFNPPGTSVPPLKQNEFGVNVGGPVLIPHLYDGRDKFHFFAFYSGFRLAAGITPSPTIIPTVAERTGDFTGLSIPIFDPTTTTCNAVTGACTRQQYSYNGTPNMISPSAISSAGSTYVQYLPQPNIASAATGTPNYVPTGVNDAVENRFGGRIDLNLTSKDVIHGFFATGANDTTNATNIFLPGISTYGAGTSDAYNSIVNVGWDHTFGPNLLLHVGAGWNRFYSPSTPPYNDNLVTYGISGGLSAETTPQMYFPPGSSPITYASTGGNGGSIGVTYAFIENGYINWTKGRHTFEFGADFHRDGSNSANKDGMNDWLLARETGQPGVANSGDAFASLLAGYFDEIQNYDYTAKFDYRINYFATFFNDTWKVTPKLTLNLGLRYEIPGTPAVVNNVFSTLDPDLPNPGANGYPGALIFAGNGDPSTYCNCRHLVNATFKLFQPRIAVAYQINDNTVVRAGYGIFTSSNGSTYGPTGSNTSGYNASPVFQTPDNGVTPAFTVASGYPAFTPPPFIDPTFDNANNIQWLNKTTNLPGIINNYTLDVQHQLAHGWLVDVGYVGNSAQHLSSYLANPQQIPLSDQLTYGTALNAALNSPTGIGTGVAAPFANFNALLGTVSSNTVAQALRYLPQYTSLTVENQNNAMSNYNSLQVKVQRHFRNGFSALGSYTWGRIFTNSEIFVSPFGDQAQDTYNQAAEYAPAFEDPPQVLTLSYDYELPFGYEKKWLNHGLMATLVGGWAVSGIHHYETGTYQFGINANNTLLIHNGYLRPDYVPGQSQKATWSGKFNPYSDPYLNPAGFTQPPPNTFGNVARNLNLRSFGYYDEALSARKNFHIREAMNFQFRADFFNAFNRTLFGSLGGANTSDPGISPTFGLLTSQGNLPRSIQFAAKFLF